ncbi:MAG: endonuclease NucS [Nostoc sp. DedQUE08]|uniref:endonuclease NucS domain-containing protein n=1 Tax=unclassified Nostoc TaxID=2593658 RepID=UPI002AD581BD|nr:MULTISPECIES: endonuclease NucS domain-containing protein [unclassified Nostoc]MDZ8066403.1 endonuclease NucS [Nostoc sp. DedQUE08]MDZ8131492.1 endonuclease NucS [Nostoc sp. DedQUE07]
MQKNVALRKTDQGWKFIDESELETFVWDNLEEIFELKPLTRQLSIKGEICDILAIGENNQLAIIELKNTEDRYVINQLTRYYDNLLEEKPLKTNVNYDAEIRLLAICPSFHRHNLIDEKHSRLNFSLFTFFIVYENNEFYFHLSQIHNKSETKIIKINYQEVNLQNQENDNIPEPPRLLLDWLGSLTNTEIENLTKIRHQILAFDHRLEETIVNKSIIYASKYGKDKMRRCAEFCYDRKSKNVLLFLWLIIPNRKNQTITRMQIDTTEEHLTYWRYIPVKEGSISWEKLINNTRFYIVPGNKGWFFNEEVFVDDIKSIVDKALQIWLERIN